MRRILLVVICLSFCSYAIADSVTSLQAAKKAESFFSGGIRTKSGSSVKLVWTWPEVQTKASNGADPLLYVFERESGGFAIVAGEDAAHPILGYSATGSFSTTDMPDNLRSFLNWYGEVLQCARDNHWSASQKMREEWDRGMTLADLDNEPSVQLETAQWGQRSPYNDLCPVIDGERCPSGCVATATAIIMRYHQWPKQGNGELPSYDYYDSGKLRNIEGHVLGHEYQWDNMPKKMPEGGYSNEQSEQIARLLYDVGIACKMGYRTDGSGADFSEAANGLLNYFDYDRSMCNRDSKMLSSFSEWESCITPEILEKRPILYSGESDFGDSHAMVIDGFRGRFFSINFGWDGFENGFYLLTPIDDYKTELVPYYDSQSFIYNIKPNKGTSTKYVSIYSNSVCEMNWANANSHDFEFRVAVSEGSFNKVDSITLCLGHFDKEGHFLDFISEQTTLVGYSEHTKSFYGNASDKAINDGDQLKVCYWSEEEQEWKVMDSIRESYYVFDLHTPLSELVSFGVSFISDEELSRSVALSGWGKYTPLISQHPELIQRMSVHLMIPPDVSSRLNWVDSEGVPQTKLLTIRDPLNGGVGKDCFIRGFYDNKLKSSGDLGTSSYRFWLPPGEYQLHIWNYNEEMTIQFKL